MSCSRRTTRIRCARCSRRSTSTRRRTSERSALAEPGGRVAAAPAGRRAERAHGQEGVQLSRRRVDERSLSRHLQPHCCSAPFLTHLTACSSSARTRHRSLHCLFTLLLLLLLLLLTLAPATSPALCSAELLPPPPCPHAFAIDKSHFISTYSTHPHRTRTPRSHRFHIRKFAGSPIA